MKIVNVCISNPYIEGFSYQENILTDYFLEEGIETPIIGSNILPHYMNYKRIKPGVYYDKGKKVIRVKCKKITNAFLIPFGLFNQLKHEKPDVIFHHNLNCTSLVICTLYKIIHPKIILIVDNHADYINSSKNKLWQLVYCKTLVRFSAKFASIFVRKFYGVTYSRCDFLHEVYGVNKNKIDFLPIGANLTAANSISDNKIELRKIHNLPQDAFLFVSGGKMGKDKGTDNLIKAVNEIQAYRTNVFLVLFGSFNDKVTENLAKDSKHVIIKGWCDSNSSLSLLKSADVAVWPVHHTTLIEDAISVKTPLLIRKTRTTEHLIDGNGFFLESTKYEELYLNIKNLLNISLISKFEIACTKMQEKLDYRVVVQKILKDIG
jgi:glycosyltransferase involved in cell wall biosynthesis